MAKNNLSNNYDKKLEGSSFLEELSRGDVSPPQHRKESVNEQKSEKVEKIPVKKSQVGRPKLEESQKKEYERRSYYLDSHTAIMILYLQLVKKHQAPLGDIQAMNTTQQDIISEAIQLLAEKMEATEIPIDILNQLKQNKK